MVERMGKLSKSDCLAFCEDNGLGDCEHICKNISPEFASLMSEVLKEEVLDALNRLDDVISDALDALDDNDPRVVNLIRDLVASLAQLVDEGRLDDAALGLIGVLDMVDDEAVDDELANELTRLARYELFLEEVKSRIISLQDALRAKREQMGI